MAGDERVSFNPLYTFNLLTTKKIDFLQDPVTSQLLMKWSMSGRICVQAFNFDQTFYPYRKDDFALSFFQDHCVRNHLKILDPQGLWRPLGKEVTHVIVEPVPCTTVSMDIFDPIFSSRILRPSGQIVKCYDEIHGDFDELRKMLLNEDSDNYNVISPSDRQEFLFRLLKHICIGGELCQYEDVIHPYMETAKMIYKDLVSVQKDPDTKEIRIVSTVLKVSAYENSTLCYPSDEDKEQTFAYLCVDPCKRHVYVLYHSHGIGFFPEAGSPHY